MFEIKLLLNKIDDVKACNEAARGCEGIVRAYDDTYVVDAKSVMGLFSLNLSTPIMIKFDTEKDQDDFMKTARAELNNSCFIS